MWIDPSAQLASANNAAWCTIVCRTHGLATETAADLWWSTERTPPLYPDCVTLVPGCAPELLLAIVDSSVGCSVKDSFADLDLGPYGFSVVHDASWIVRDSTAVSNGPVLRWRRVGGAGAFAGWVHSWCVASDGPPDVLRPALLDDPSVTVLAADLDGEIVGGAIVNEAASVLGVSNVFTKDATIDPWPSLVTYLVRHHRERVVVGYASGNDLERALAARFRIIGPLRVWMRVDA